MADYLRIVDPVRFQRLLAEIRRRCGGQEKAAEKLGIEQSQFSRWLNGVSHHISRPVARRMARNIIRGMVPPKERPTRANWRRQANFQMEKEFWLAVLTREAAATMRTYEEWLEEEALGRSLMGLPRRALELPITMRRRRHLTESRIQQLLRELAEEPYRAIIGEFVDRYRRRRFQGREEPEGGDRYWKDWPRHSWDTDFDTRLELAIVRALEPLLATLDTGGVERGWRELDQRGELERYLKVALRREEILLNRAPDVERAQEIDLARREGKPALAPVRERQVRLLAGPKTEE